MPFKLSQEAPDRHQVLFPSQLPVYVQGNCILRVFPFCEKSQRSGSLPTPPPPSPGDSAPPRRQLPCASGFPASAARRPIKCFFLITLEDRETLPRPPSFPLQVAKEVQQVWMLARFCPGSEAT